MQVSPLPVMGERKVSKIIIDLHDLASSAVLGKDGTIRELEKDRKVDC